MKKVIILLSIGFSINNFGSAVALFNGQKKNVSFQEVFSIEQLIQDLEIISTVTSNNINQYKVLDRDGDTVVHILVKRIIEIQHIAEVKRIKEEQGIGGLRSIADQEKSKQKTKEDIEQLKVYMKSLNKLSAHFDLFRNVSNQSGSTPFDILIQDSFSMAIAGSIKNFKNLLPRIQSDQEALSTTYNTSAAIAAASKALQVNPLRKKKRGLLVPILEEE
jgi:hypothetical protein